MPLPYLRKQPTSIIKRYPSFVRNVTIRNVHSRKNTPTLGYSHTSWGKTFLDFPFPSSIYLRHESTILKPRYSGFSAWVGLLSFSAVNTGVFILWQNDDEAWQEKMNDHFTCSIRNTKERPWTLFNACISHQSFAHYFGNMAALWIFGFSTFRVIGPASFISLYCYGGIISSMAHVGLNAFTGRTGPTLTKEEIALLEKSIHGKQDEEGHVDFEKYVPPDLLRKFRASDMPSLGASGSIMAVSAVCATLFPLDKIRLPNPRVRVPVNIPVVVGIYVFSDLIGITAGQDGDNVGHSAHLGGVAFGSLFSYRNWYKGAWKTTGDLPLLYRLRQWRLSRKK